MDTVPSLASASTTRGHPLGTAVRRRSCPSSRHSCPSLSCPFALLLPAAPANADPTNAHFYGTQPSVCSSLGEVTLYYTGTSFFAANKVENAQVTLLLRELTITQTDTTTGEVLLEEVALEKQGSVPIDETCSFSFEADGVTVTITGGFLLRGPTSV